MIFYQLLHYPVWQFLNFKSDPLFTSPVVERGCVASSSVVLAGSSHPACKQTFRQLRFKGTS